MRKNQKQTRKTPNRTIKILVKDFSVKCFCENMPPFLLLRKGKYFSSSTKETFLWLQQQKQITQPTLGGRYQQAVYSQCLLGVKGGSFRCNGLGDPAQSSTAGEGVEKTRCYFSAGEIRATESLTLKGGEFITHLHGFRSGWRHFQYSLFFGNIKAL